MRTFDFAPLYKSAIGFDRLASLFEDAMRADTQPSYPPYNVERVEDDHYRITMAVAGFKDSELDVQVEADTLTVAARKAEQEERTTYLHRGIATRSFNRQFRLADHVEVTGARLENGLLHIDLERRIPDAMKPRKIAVEAADAARVIEDQAA